MNEEARNIVNYIGIGKPPKFEVGKMVALYYNPKKLGIVERLEPITMGNPSVAYYRYHIHWLYDPPSGHHYLAGELFEPPE
jgi:hypothetical protein